jgi:hypothetical protein
MIAVPFCTAATCNVLRDGSPAPLPLLPLRTRTRRCYAFAALRLRAAHALRARPSRAYIGLPVTAAATRRVQRWHGTVAVGHAGLFPAIWFLYSTACHAAYRARALPG